MTTKKLTKLLALYLPYLLLGLIATNFGKCQRNGAHHRHDFIP